MGDEEEEGGVSVLMAPPPSLHNHTSSNAPPPPPPPPLPMGVANPVERKRRVRSFYWKPIPEDRVNQQRGTNLWTLGRLSKEEIFHIDVSAIEELFGQHEETQSPTATSSRIRRERGSMKDFTEQITFLDSKRNMSISIFLKHFKRSGDSLLEDIRHGNADAFAVETLRELLKLLPEDEEVKNLQMFSGNIKDLNTADSFIYQLIHLPRYKVRLEALLVKVEYQPSYSAMKQEISIILAAIKELLNCEELHRILHLVLQAGNIINAGGYAGNAVGFKLSSLLSLADTKANRPRMNLLHFVALEAQKKHLLMFPEKLPHVQQAARVCVDSIHVEFSTLSRRVHEVEENIQEDSELLTQLQPFLKSAGEALEDLRVRCEEMTREGNALIDFFCEDKETFRLDECFQIFQDFCAKFRRAVQENQEREKWEASRRRRLKELEEKRHSWAGHEGVGGVFGLRCSSETDVEAALKREGLLGLLKTDPQSTQGPPQRFWSVRRSRQQISPESANPDMNFDPSGADTHILPPIHTLSITHTPTNAHTPSDSLSEGYVHSHDHTNANTTGNHDRSLKSEQEDNVMTFDPETPEKTSSIPETRNDTQTQTSQGQETLGKMEVTADLTFGPTKNGLEAEATSAACSQSESSTGGDERISATSQHDELNSLKTGREDAQSALIHANKPPSKTSTAKHTPSSHALKSSSILRSSPQRPVRTLTPSETQSLRKVVPITRPGSSGPKNQEQKTPNRSALNSASAKKRHVVRPPPEEKMCRATLRALSSPPPQNHTHNRHAPSFARNTVASATRHADVPGRQPAATTAPPLTRAASLRLSQLHRRQQSTPITPITPNTPVTPNTPITPITPNTPITPITPSRTASVRLPHLTKNSSGFIENSQKSIRPAWK